MPASTGVSLREEKRPFSVNETRMLDCQFGQKYYKQKQKQGKKMWLQGTRKMGCMAHIEVKTFMLHTE